MWAGTPIVELCALKTTIALSVHRDGVVAFVAVIFFPTGNKEWKSAELFHCVYYWIAFLHHSEPQHSRGQPNPTMNCSSGSSPRSKICFRLRIVTTLTAAHSSPLSIPHNHNLTSLEWFYSSLPYSPSNPRPTQTRARPKAFLCIHKNTTSPPPIQSIQEDAFQRAASGDVQLGETWTLNQLMDIAARLPSVPRGTSRGRGGEENPIANQGVSPP